MEVTVTVVLDCVVTVDGVLFPSIRNLAWSAGTVDDLAKRDGIEPPTGVALRDLIMEMYGLKEPKKMQVIRW